MLTRPMMLMEAFALARAYEERIEDVSQNQHLCVKGGSRNIVLPPLATTIKGQSTVTTYTTLVNNSISSPRQHRAATPTLTLSGNHQRPIAIHHYYLPRRFQYCD